MKANDTDKQAFTVIDGEPEADAGTTKALRQLLDAQADGERTKLVARKRQQQKQALQGQPLPMNTEDAIGVVVARLSEPDGLITSRYDMEALTAQVKQLAGSRDNRHLQGVLAQQIPLVQALSIRYAHEAAVATSQEAQEAYTKLSLRCSDSLVKLAGGIATLRQMDDRGQP